MAGIHQTLREARSLYDEALKLKESVLASHRDLKGCVAQIEAWHESMGRLAARVETLTVRLKKFGWIFISLVCLLCLLASASLSKLSTLPATLAAHQVAHQRKAGSASG